MLFFFELKAIIRLTRGQFIAFALFFMSIPIFIFSSIHLAIATLMFGTSGLSLQWDEMYRLISVGISAISSGIIIMGVRHLFDFVDFIRNREYDTLLSKQNQGGMDTLFMRIFFMQFTVIFGGVISKTTHNPVLGVSLLVLLQTIYGISSFLKSKKS
ncbi:hypothetical protein HY311_02520 [Candidatus Nomurabacteria bacterium]|nr:hypothetical protein [Candidatus Nomurabacteria bacterium]